MKANILIIFTLLIIFVFSCYNREKRCKLSKVDKQMIPYELGQTINFIDSLGHPIVLLNDHDKISWVGENGYLFYECRHISMKSQLDNFHIGIIVEASCYASNNNNIYVIVNSFELNIEYNSKGEFVTNDYAYQQKPLESLEINGKIYYDLVENKRYNHTIYYNKTYGVLQLIIDGRDVLTINQ